MTLTTERLKQLADPNRVRKCSMVEYQSMARELLANREAQPVQGLELAGWQFKSVNGDWLGLIDEHGKNQAVREGCEVRKVYAIADSPNARDAVREAHAEWSRSTFGNVGPIGPLKHLSKEALEAAAQPDDLSEWADMQFLLWDAQRRAGITDEQITQAMIEKLSVNKKREWPEPKDGEPRLHITAPPAPAPAMVRELLEAMEEVIRISDRDHDAWNRVKVAITACRGAIFTAPHEPDPIDVFVAQVCGDLSAGHQR